MVATFVVAVRRLPRGRLEHVDAGVEPVPQTVPDTLYS
jgi:hypothetical protein